MSYVFRNGAFDASGGWWHEDCIVDDPSAVFDVEFPWQYDDRDREWAKIPTPVLDSLFEKDIRFLTFTLIGKGFQHGDPTLLPPPDKETMGMLIGPAGTGKSAFLSALGEIYPPGAIDYYWLDANCEEEANRKLKAAVAERQRVIAGWILPVTKPFSNYKGLKEEMPWIMVKSVKAYLHFVNECRNGRNPMPQ